MKPYYAVVGVLALLFVVAMTFFFYRDNRSEDHCHALGGQTWDSGQHCVIGTYRVVDTHNRIWG